jgi:hypothetical protein
MPPKRDAFGSVRAWVAPGLGLGLVVAGIAMAAGMSKIYAPLVAAGSAAVVLLFGKWWDNRRGTNRGARA